MSLENFPRGGKKRILKSTSEQVFQKDKKKLKKKKSEKKSANEDKTYDKDITLDIQKVERLSVQTLSEGMVILGRINELRDYDLVVSVPGGLHGQVQVTDLCQSYTNLLRDIVNPEDVQCDIKTIPELYNLGEYVVCYVKSIQANRRYKVHISLEPHLINRNINPTSLTIGSKIICSVSSVEDHGYVMDTGIENVRAFISTKNVDKDVQYFPGKQLQCIIQEIYTVDNVSNIKLTAKQKILAQHVCEDIEVLDTLMPGTLTRLHVDKVLCNGLKVSFGENRVSGYINQIYIRNNLSEYEQGKVIDGTLLYIMPIIKIPYFSLLVNNEDMTLKAGDIVNKAKVLYIESNGIIMNLAPKLRGYVPLRKCGIDFDKVTTKFSPNSKHKCRVLFYNWLEQMYVCTTENKLIEEKYFSSSDLSVGQVVQVKVVNIDTKSKYVSVAIGRVRGSVVPEHISDFGPSALSTLKIDQIVEARVLKIDEARNKLNFTLKKSLVHSDLPILTNLEKAKYDEKYHGTIVQINKNGLLVRFFGDAKGWVPSAFLDKRLASLKWNYSIGQTVTVTVREVNVITGQATLRIVTEKSEAEKEEEEKDELLTFSVGESVEGTVIDSSVEGVVLQIEKKNGSGFVKGFLPAGHIAPCKEIAALLASRYVPGDRVNALVFATIPTLLLSRTYVPNEKYRNFEQLKVGDCIPCSIKEITPDGLKVVLPINNYKDFVFISCKRITNYDLMYVHQILFVKILEINRKDMQLQLTMSLEKIWTDKAIKDSRIMASTDILSIYLNKLKELACNSYYKNRSISSAKLGQMVHGKVEKITHYGLVLKLPNNLQAVVPVDHYRGNFKIGDDVTGKIIWINYIHEFVEVTLLSNLVNTISASQNTSLNLPLSTLLRGDIVLVTNWLILLVLKGQGKGMLVALPARRHINDLRPNLKPYMVSSRVRCYVVLHKNESDIVPICMLKSAFEEIKSTPVSAAMAKGQKNVVNNKKNSRKNTNAIEQTGTLKKENIDDTNNVKESSIKELVKKKKEVIKENTNKENNIDIEILQNIKKEDDNDVNHKKVSIKRKKELSEDNNNTSKKKRKKEKVIDDIVDKVIKVEKVESNESHLPECGFYWDNVPNSRVMEDDESSSDSENEDDQQQKPKTKKLSAAERRELERQKEREIREREEALASNQIPNSIDQFDRLVLSSPDSSLIWLQYMAYHLQATEIEKARAVARRAIKTINFREENERLNVWNAWLNLESKFGTPESLNDVFQEAVRTNDALKIYTHMLTVHVDANRQFELEKLISTMIRKFKENPQMWVNCGAALLKLGLKDKSRQIMQRALQSLQASEHVNLMIRFANLENQFGDRERSQTLFEQILSSYPKRVDVWSSYVDSLVKHEDIDLARKVLERAVVQSLPPRKMRTLFKKFIAFEEKHGTPQDVKRVQQMATEYIEKQCGEHVNSLA